MTKNASPFWLAMLNDTRLSRALKLLSFHEIRLIQQHAGADLINAIREAQPHVCSLLCPSTKRTGEEWTHVPLCERLTTLTGEPK